jgi:hypothetical protein
VKGQRTAVLMALHPKAFVPSFPCVVRLTRYAPRLLDSDNCVGSLKAVRDAVAFFLQVNDADPRVVWEYDQEKSRQGYQVKIEIRPEGESCIT